MNHQPLLGLNRARSGASNGLDGVVGGGVRSGSVGGVRDGPSVGMIKDACVKGSVLVLFIQ